MTEYEQAWARTCDDCGAQLADESTGWLSGVPEWCYRGEWMHQPCALMPNQGSSTMRKGPHARGPRQDVR